MELLPNGRQLVAFINEQPGKSEGRQVIGYEAGAPHPFAVWYQREPGAECYHGDYCHTYDEALATAILRSGWGPRTLGELKDLFHLRSLRGVGAPA